jgi:hypothetical protein
MKTQNIIVITNLTVPNKAIAVKNFADDLVKEAIGKLMNINPKDLQCQASGNSDGIYEVTKSYRNLKDEVARIILGTDKIYIHVDYATLYE